MNITFIIVSIGFLKNKKIQKISEKNLLTAIKVKDADKSEESGTWDHKDQVLFAAIFTVLVSLFSSCYSLWFIRGADYLRCMQCIELVDMVTCIQKWTHNLLPLLKIEGCCFVIILCQVRQTFLWYRYKNKISRGVRGQLPPASTLPTF